MLVGEKLNKKISSADEVVGVFQEILKNRCDVDSHREMFYSLGLNSQNLICYIDLVTIGTVNSACPQIRECLSVALKRDAVSIIVCHNQPSGRIKPSVDDFNFTRKLNEACTLIGIKLLDHIIIGGEDYYSFSDNNNLR